MNNTVYIPPHWKKRGEKILFFLKVKFFVEKLGKLFSHFHNKILILIKYFFSHNYKKKNLKKNCMIFQCWSSFNHNAISKLSWKKIMGKF